MGGNEITCAEVVEIVTAYLEGSMSAETRRRFEQHLTSCDGCTTFLDQIRETIALTGRLHEEALSADARRRLLEAFRGWGSR